MALTMEDNYLLARDMLGSIRLDAQHALWTIHNGWTMNPRIPIKENMKIAEIGTGTGLWLLDLAARLPKTVTLDGFDISHAQFPPSSLLPSNVTLRTMNALKGVPDELCGKYDVVHLRFWSLILSHDRVDLLFEHVKALLKPGGYVQWEDADVIGNDMRGDEADALSDAMEKTWKGVDLFPHWVKDMAQYAEKVGLKVLEHYYGPISPAVVPLATRTYLGALDEMFVGMSRRKDSSLPSSAQCRQLVASLNQKWVRGEAMFNWTAVTMFAQKPLDG